MLTPEEIQSREFLVSLRGYDRDEVHAFLGRVAEQLAQTEAKASQLQQRLDRLKDQQGQAAVSEPSAPAPATASPEPSAMFAEIGKETQRILEAAQEAGQQIQRKARQEADRDLQSARSQAAKLIAEGERRREHIERIVGELEQSRASMSVQLRGIGRTIEQTLRELAPSDGTSTVREAIGAEAARDAEGGPAGNGGIPAEQAGSTAGDTPAAAAVVAPAEEAPVAEEPAEEEEEPAPVESPAPEETPPPDDVPAAEEAVDNDEASAAAPDTDTTVDSDEDAGAAESAEQASVPAVDAPVQEAPAAPAPRTDDDNAPSPAGLPADEPTAAAAPSQPEQTADDEPAEATADDAAAAPAPVASEPAMPPAAPPAPVAGADQDPQGMRAAALSPLHPKLVRKVKRELQEIQNIALDKVRRAKGQGDVDTFLPSDEDTSGLGEGAADLLEQAWRAGVAAAGQLAERSIDVPDDIPDLAGGFVQEATERVRSGLSASLKMGLSGEEDQQGLSDRIGSVFSDFKGAQSEELAATHLIRAYEQGLLGAWKSAGISARAWVMGREPRCPEAKCRGNDMSSPVPVGEQWPSGHDVPPIHVGCTCTTLPVEESSA